ncbi:MAG: 50S ribosomal protein L18 [Acidobacteria bacterium]|nr:50S ribosomal protein L18 [Acidobacteriota bacterium]MCH8971187.1 50S ribosomal protein L18 [Acidobacteriota bacterium]MCZ6505363.1 50S ribosomal protein L18 [Actinomycetota bacterium]MCZ6568134.1 50S ribosomal protein L18 [Actinomycetota bacterium]MCZ6738477.1 50S ribosomal protein L18 [Actinomycetota bacterium]
MRGSRQDARSRRHFRVRKRIRGTEARPRLAVHRSNRYIYAQVIDDVDGHTLAAASSLETDLRSDSLNVGTATKVGSLVASRAKDAGVSAVVFDRGGFKFHGKIKALAEAAREEGLEF